MSVTLPGSAGQRLFREHLDKDAPQRELSVARFMVFAAGVSSLVAFSLQRVIGVSLSVLLGALLAALAAYYGVVWRKLRGGWFNRAVSWVNVMVEVSAPSLIFVADVTARGPEYALTAPPLAIWGTLVSLSALRGSRPLAIAAGALAAMEYLALYFLLAYPRLSPEALVTLRPPLIATRAFLLMCAGLITAAFVRHFNRRAEEALSAVRAQDVLGKYILHQRIGSGGMAEVFLASYSPEGGYEKTVAVKKILPAYADDRAFIMAFRKEAELTSRLNHPNVIQVMDFGQFQDTYFLAMEHIEGLSLKKVIDAHPQGLPLEAVFSLARQLFLALDYVHQKTAPDGTPLNLVHRDVNPPNILVSVIGEVKLTDFGIARIATEARVTEAGMIKGKAGYLAPEQLTDETLDGRTDLFAVGATLHEALTGRPLFTSTDTEREEDEVLRLELLPPSHRRPELTAEIDQAVMALLQRNPDDRVATASEALEQWEALAQQAAREGQAALAAAVKTSKNQKLGTMADRTAVMQSAT